MSHTPDREQRDELQPQDSEVVLSGYHQTDREMLGSQRESLAQGDDETLIDGLPPIRREASTSPSRSYIDELADLGLDLEPSRRSIPQERA